MTTTLNTDALERQDTFSLVWRLGSPEWMVAPSRRSSGCGLTEMNTYRSPASPLLQGAIQVEALSACMQRMRAGEKLEMNISLSKQRDS